MQIFDSHTHINSSEFKDDLPDVIERAKALDVTRMLVIAYDQPSTDKLLELLAFEGIYGAVGCHPESADKWSLDYEKKLVELFKTQPKLKVLGEIGLDYHCDLDYELQKKVFARQIKLAQELNLPISVHNRDAFEDCYEILKQNQIWKNGGIMHSFNGDKQWAQKFLDLGMRLSYSGVVTFSSAKDVKDAALATPLENILVETDAPYLTPHPFRGQMNEPAMTRYTLEYLAQLKGLTAKQLAQITTENTKRLLKIK